MNRFALSFVALAALSGSAFAQGVDYAAPAQDSAAIQGQIRHQSGGRVLTTPISSPVQSFDNRMDEEFLQVQRDERSPRFTAPRGDVRAIEGVRVPNNIGSGE